MSKNLYFVLILALMVAFILGGCERSAAAPSSLPTPTLPAESLPSDEAATEDQMALLWAYATQTAMVSTPSPTVAIETPTPEEIVETPTETPVLPPTGMPPTPTLVFFTPAAPITPVSGRPATYALQPGEFPYCIARRFNVDPQELLALNGLTDGEIYYPGLTLQIPQTGNPWPGERALHPHPSTYTVSSSQETLYHIACYYGDVDPLQIAALNNLTSPYTLQVGQTLSIP